MEVPGTVVAMEAVGMTPVVPAKAVRSDPLTAGSAQGVPRAPPSGAPRDVKIKKINSQTDKQEHRIGRVLTLPPFDC